jgi:hypothetical protein
LLKQTTTITLLFIRQLAMPKICEPAVPLSSPRQIHGGDNDDDDTNERIIEMLTAPHFDAARQMENHFVEGKGNPTFTGNGKEESCQETP